MNDNCNINGDKGDHLCGKVCASAPYALVVVNDKLEVMYANANAQQYAGTPEQIAARLTDADISGSEPDQQISRMLRKTLRDRNSREFDVDFGPAGNQRRSFRFQMTPLCPAGSGGSCVAVWAQDVTGYRQMSDQLIAAEKMASLGAMAGGVAHHFNSVIDGITVAVDTALTDNDPAHARRALLMTSEAISRIARLTQSLMSFSGHDKKRSDLADLTEVILTFIQLVERPLDENGISIELNLARIPIVAVEANRMHHVLGNLLTNSEEAIKGSGCITISTGCDDNWVWLDFADDGCGIDSEHINLIFDPFFTTKGLVNSADGGNPGLGLSVARGLVLDMGGDIIAMDVEDGASMRLRFPHSNPGDT